MKGEVQNFKQNINAFDQYLRSQGSSANTLKQQIKGELAWSRLLRRNIQPFINVGDMNMEKITRIISEELSYQYDKDF